MNIANTGVYFNIMIFFPARPYQVEKLESQHAC